MKRKAESGDAARARRRPKPSKKALELGEADGKQPVAKRRRGRPPKASYITQDLQTDGFALDETDQVPFFFVFTITITFTFLPPLPLPLFLTQRHGHAEPLGKSFLRETQGKIKVREAQVYM